LHLVHLLLNELFMQTCVVSFHIMAISLSKPNFSFTSIMYCRESGTGSSSVLLRLYLWNWRAQAPVVRRCEASVHGLICLLSELGGYASIKQLCASTYTAADTRDENCVAHMRII
jgi:hypothetical protein